MESWCLSKHKSSLLIFIMLLFFMVGWIQGLYLEDERKALLQIKASLHELSNFLHRDNLLPTWVDHGSSGGKYCDWERIKCDTTSGYVTDLFLSDMFSMEDFIFYYDMNPPPRMIWPLNASLFLHFKELRSLDLSMSYIGNTFVSTGLKRLSSLKKLEMLNLSRNFIETNIFPSLSELTSLKILDLSYLNEYPYSPTYDISRLSALENLEELYLSGGGYYGNLQLQGTVSTLRKLKVLDLSSNNFNESLVTSLRSLTSLEALDLSGNLFGSFPSQEFSNLTNLKKLDLSGNSISSTEGCKSLMRLKKLESISLGFNNFNKSIISCLSFLPSLNILDLSGSSNLGSSFPMQELSNLTNLKKLDLSYNFDLNITPSMEGCKSLMRLKKLESISLTENRFNKSIISCLSFLPSLNFLDLRYNYYLGGSFPMQELSSLKELKTLYMDECGLQSIKFNELCNLRRLEVLYLGRNDFNGTLAMKDLTCFHPLKVLDLGYNHFTGSIPSTIKSLSSLRFVSFAGNSLNGSLSDHGLCELKNLQELDLSRNMFDGKLPTCFNSLSSLKLFDISFNRFTGIILPSLIANLTSLEYIDFSHNKFEGLFSFSSFSSHKKLEVVAFISDNDKFLVKTEEPIGWTPMFQLKALVLSNCNLNRPEGSVIPSFLLHQHELRKLDMSHNSLEGQFPNWLIKNNTMLEVLSLRSNSFDGNFCLGIYRNPKTRRLDMSGNHMNGTIPRDIQEFLPNIRYLNLSRNSLHGVIPSSVGDLIKLNYLDLSHNELSGELPTGLLKKVLSLSLLILSNNSFHGEVLSGNLNWGHMERLQLDSNSFTGKIGSTISTFSPLLSLLDISNNFFTGLLPGWISNMSYSRVTFVARNNSLGGQFPCGTTSFMFLDISENNFSGPIPSCLNFQSLEHLHLGSNRFTGSIPSSFCNLTNVLTLDIGNNYLSGKIPKFLGELPNLRILLLRKNNFSGSIPKELCKLTNAGLIDLSSNFLSGSIPRCLQNITGPSDQAFMQSAETWYSYYTSSLYTSVLDSRNLIPDVDEMADIQDEVLFTTKSLFLPYTGGILDIMSGLDLSSNKLTGDIPEELGLLTQIRVLNLSHNRLSGLIPVKFSNLVNVESLDLSFNCLTGNVPSELINLNSLSIFNVSFNNLSGRLPDMKAQFSTFTKENYEGNPLLCGPPLENNCTIESHVTHPLNEDATDENWYHVDMASFYGSASSTWFVFILGFAAILYINPYWRRRWLDSVEECMYTCYYFLFDSSRKLFMVFSSKSFN